MKCRGIGQSIVLSNCNNHSVINLRTSNLEPYLTRLRMVSKCKERITDKNSNEIHRHLVEF